MRLRARLVAAAHLVRFLFEVTLLLVVVAATFNPRDWPEWCQD